MEKLQNLGLEKTPKENSSIQEATLTVKEALEKYPNAKQAFQKNGDESCIYLMLDKPVDIKSTHPQGLLYSVSCLKLVVATGQLFKVKVYIKKPDVITDVTFAMFQKNLEEGLAKIEETLQRIPEDRSLVGCWKLYETCGYPLKLS